MLYSVFILFYYLYSNPSKRELLACVVQMQTNNIKKKQKQK